MGKLRHGYAVSGKVAPEHAAYRQAKNRCTNPKSDKYHRYGGRGIEFKFESFEEWHAELGDKPEPKRLYSVDRKNNDGHYEPGNVRWTTKKEQATNRHTVVPSRSGVRHSAATIEKLRMAKIGKPWTEARRRAHNRKNNAAA